MKSLMSLTSIMLNELGMRCCTSVERDLKTITSRFEHEGLSFLTITLPSFGKDLLKSLDQGYVGSNQFSGFRRSGGLPAFLQGFLCQVFERSSGELLPEPCIESIRAIRQFCGLFEKINLRCSEKRVRKAMDSYVQCELEVRCADRRQDFGSSSRSLVSSIRTSFAMLFGDSINRVNRDLRSARYDRFLPKHGPGRTADCLVGNQKYYQSVWTVRLEAVLPAGEFVIPSWRWYRSLRGIDFHEPGTERPVRVVDVPKSLKTPRIIAMEPTCMQYAQQSVLRAILDSFDEDPFVRELITFQDQTPNQRMALQGSIDQSLATVDLSEASDRVSNQLVRYLLAPWPDFSEAVDACRSRSADVPGHGVVRLAKFASMGSALTFPIETMVFLAVVFNRFRELNSHLRGKALKQAVLRQVRAYGDDLIVPVDIVRQVIDDLEALGSKVNVDKTFFTGSFRESCGKEYYAGIDVSIVRCRSVFPTSPDDASEVVAMVDFRNQLYKAGFKTTCQWLDKKISKILGIFPLLAPTSSGLGRHSCIPPILYRSEIRDKSRSKNDYQRPEVRAWVVTAPIPRNGIEGYPALVKCLTTGFNPDVKHLKHSGRPRALSIKKRWVSVT